MNKSFFISLLLCLPYFIQAQTIISTETISGTWTTKGSPYIIEKGVEVADGSTLTIRPGVVIKFKAGASLKVYKGEGLSAIGKKDSMIVFTSNLASPKPGDWENIYLSGTGSKVTLNYCRIEYSVIGVSCIAWASGCSSGDNYSLIENCEIKYTKNVAISCSASGNSSQGCIPIRSVGVCKPTVKGNKIYFNEGKGISMSSYSGYFSTGYTSPEVIGNQIFNNKSDAIDIFNLAGLNAKVLNNTIYGNLGNGISIEGKLDTTNLLVQNNQIIANLNGIFIKDASEPLTVYNNFWNNKNAPSSTKSLHKSNLLIDPEFVNAALGDFQLRCTSPCIDAGNPKSPKDVDGSRSDIGALWFDHSPLKGSVTGNFAKPICKGSSIIIEASDGVNYEWSGPKKFSYNGNKVTITNATLEMSGIYTVSIMDVNKCVKTISVKVNIETCTATHNNINRNGDVTIYPNPAKDNINLMVNNWIGDLNISIIDAFGKERYRQQLISSSFQEQFKLNTNFLSKGIYWIRISDQVKMELKKMVVQ